MTAKLGQAVIDIRNSLAQIKDSTSDIEVKVDGGGFK